jgi:bacteriocin-like protein
MKKLHVTNKTLKEISREELKNITGGGEITTCLECVSTTLTGGGGLRSFVLGVTIFGMARMLGVMVGSSGL